MACRQRRAALRSFPQTEAELAGRCPVRVTGNPVRCKRAAAAADVSPPQLLILGGSSGARSLNESVPRAIYKAGAVLGGWRIVHQSGEADLIATRQLYGKLGIEASVVAFLHDLPDVLSASQLAVCRAGGTTLAELAAAGLPAVLVPYPHAAADHQRVNAETFSSTGAAALVDERDLPGRLDDRLAEVLTALAGDADRRAKMSAAMLSLAYPDAAADVAALVWSVVSSQARRRVAGRVKLAPGRCVELALEVFRASGRDGRSQIACGISQGLHHLPKGARVPVVPRKHWHKPANRPDRLAPGVPAGRIAVLQSAWPGRRNGKGPSTPRRPARISLFRLVC